MSDHSDLADERDTEADDMERENERLQEGVDEAKQTLRSANADSLIPAAEDEPGAGGGEEPEGGDDEPETDYPAKR